MKTMKTVLIIALIIGGFLTTNGQDKVKKAYIIFQKNIAGKEKEVFFTDVKDITHPYFFDDRTKIAFIDFIRTKINDAYKYSFNIPNAYSYRDVNSHRTLNPQNFK
jgi:hypothetical protein